MIQLLREWPPGYGGVERVAHELAHNLQKQGRHSCVVSLFAQPQLQRLGDPLPVIYTRTALPRLRLGELLLPLPSRALGALLLGQEPLHAHLPCPTVLLLAAFAKVMRPSRRVSIHWHAFLAFEPTLHGCFVGIYQWLALRLLPLFDRVVTTSPVLKEALIATGLPQRKSEVLPCCLPEHQEQQSLQYAEVPFTGCLRLISISRLGSYKRVDWLLEALAQVAASLNPAQLSGSLRLDVIGDGPDRKRLEQQARSLLPGIVHFHGRVDEAKKLSLLHQADVLILAADRCNEAFGLVQLEAMACGTAAVALDLARSGMGWVSHNPALHWSGKRADLARLIQAMHANRELLLKAKHEARQRYLALFQRQHWQRAFNKVLAP